MEPIAPAFKTPLQRWVFAATIVLFLLLPSALGLAGRPTLRDRLRSVPAAGGDFAAIEHHILDESGDIDLLILGTSYLWAAIDTPFLEKELTSRFGRPFVARTIGSNFRGEDMYLMLLEETLARRRVGALVLSLPAARDRRDSPHPYAHRVAGPGYAARYEGLSAREQGAAAGIALLGASRHALTFLRHERSERSPLIATRGALLSHAGFAGAAFVAVDPPALEPPAEETTYGSGTSSFCFDGEPLAPSQQLFTARTIALAQRHGVRVAVINIPKWHDRGADGWPSCVHERLRWPEVFPGTVLIGIPSARLFGSMSETEAQRYFFSGHMNANGARYLTRALLPALERVMR